MFFAIYRLLFTQFKQNIRPLIIGGLSLVVTAMNFSVLIRNSTILTSIL